MPRVVVALCAALVSAATVAAAPPAGSWKMAIALGERPVTMLFHFSEADGKFLWQHSSEKMPTGRVHDWPLQGICFDGGVDILMPETTFETEAVWFCPELHHLEGLEQMPKLLGTLHAAEHSLIALLPLWAMCDRWDIGGLSTNIHHQTGSPTIFIYDGHPGGVGITLQGFRNFDLLVGDAHRLIDECPCESGCPSCVQSPKCGNLNEPLSKAGALELMGRMLQR
jgi:hypothetical protein